MLGSKILKIFILLNILLSSTYCSTLLTKKNKVKEVEFDYEIISKNYFLPGNEKPFPLTVQKGNNLHSTTSKDGKFLFYSSNTKGNYDIYIRDLKSSSALPLTTHPAAEYKPTISPDSKHIIYVSEEDDSKGDLILCEVNPDQIFKDHLLGKHSVFSEKINLTNPDGKDSYYDTDPSYSPDGLKVVFSSNRLTPEIQNIVIMDLKNPENIYRISELGGSNPTFSLDGKYIIYVSFKYHKNGDIVIINIESGEEKYLTNDNYPDFTPSFGSTPNNVYFTSIREDTNKDGIIDEKDVSRIVKKNQDSLKEYILTPSEYSSFDSRYSNFNGGSIIYSASVFNSINIYFFPSSGLIPKKDSPQDQLKIIDDYLSSEKDSIVQIALDSMELYFENHPLFPIYQTKTEILKLQFLSNKRKKDELRNEFNLIFNDQSEEPKSLYKKILAYNLKSKLYGTKHNREIELLYKIFEKKQDGSTIHPAFLEAYAESKLIENNVSDAISIYNRIINLFPEYYNIVFIKLRMGDIVFTPISNKIPEVYMNLLDEPIRLEDKIQALIDIENDIKFAKNPTEKLQHCDNLISENNLLERSNELYKLVTYIKAESLSESKNFIESNILLDKITDPVPIINPICAFTPGCKQKLPCENDRVCLKVHLLKALNNENMGNYNTFFEELKIYLQGYNPELKVLVDKSEIEKNFRYFELKAKEYENMGMLRESALNFFYNTENMFLLKEKNLYVNSIYKNFGNYYYKKMVDYIMKYARQQAQDERDSIINKLNIIGNEDLDLIGNYNKVISYLPKNRISSVIIDSLKIDVSNEVVLGKPGSNDDALRLIEQHFKLSRPRSRPVLYLASLFGYAYYQIQKSIEMDEYYRKKGNLTPNKKEKILENLKIAEFELKWIIFADQEFIDAYLLLGYLYQYIDLSRIEAIREVTEGEEFVEIYDRYFPGNNLEKNIDLYKQIITFIGDTPNKKNLSDIHLNLGNAYLYLNNFSKANENYKLVNDFSNEIINEVQFSDPKQKALFHYNFTKSLLSNNEFLNADLELNKLIEFYSDNLNFSYDSNQLNQKLVLIYTLKGYANSELKNYDEAIENYSKALAINSNYIPILSLYNSLAYNYIMKRDFEEAKKYIILAKKEYKEDGLFVNLHENFDIWNILLPEKLRTIGDGKISKTLPSSLQYLWTTGNELLLASLNYDENKVSDIIQERNLFISKNNLYKYNIDSNILNYDKSLLANIYYENKNYNLSSKIYNELYDKEKSWRYLLNQSYTIFREESIDTDDRIKKIMNFSYILKKYKSNFIKNCSIVKSKNSEFCEIEFFKAHKEYEIIEGNIYHTLYLNYQTLGNLFLSSYYYSLYFDLYNFINSKDSKFSRNDPYGKIDRVKLLLNQLISVPEDQFEDKSKELEFYIKEFQLREEDFLISIIKIKYYLKSKNFIKVKSIFDTNSDLFLQMVYSPIINENELLEYIQLEIEYNYLNNSLYNIPSLEEKKIAIQTIRTFLKYTFEFRVNVTKREYLLLKEAYDKFTKNILNSKNNFNNNGQPISYSETMKYYENFNNHLNQFINTNERFYYLKFPKSLRNIPKNSISITKFDNYYLFFGKNNKYLYKYSCNQAISNEELDSVIKGEVDNLIIYIDINEIDKSILQYLESTNKSLFFSYQDIESQRNSYVTLYSEKNKIEQIDNLYDRYNIEVDFKSKIFSDLFQTSSKSFTLKNNIENDYFIPSIHLNSYPKESNLIGIFLRMSNFKDISYSFNGYNIKFGSKKESKLKIEEILNSAFKLEHTDQYKEAIRTIKSIDQNNLEVKEKLDIDLILARLYAKEIKNHSYEDFFNNLLTKYKSKEEKLRIKKEEIRYCYIFKFNNCYNKVKSISNLLKDSSIDVNIRIKFLNSLNYYENYANDLYQNIYKEHEEFNLQESTEDEFLFLTNNINFFINNYHFDEAIYFLNKLSLLQLEKDELNIYSSFQEEIYLISKLIGIPTNLKIDPKENIYFDIVNRNFDQISNKSKNDKSSLDPFRNNIYKSYLRLEIGENFPISILFNKKLVSGSTFYSKLDLKDKLILFYIFSKSFSNQRENEITEMVFTLLHPENGIDSKISANLLLVYAESAINRNDTKTSNLVLDFFNLKYQNHLLDDYIKNKYESLKIKNLFLSSNIYNNNSTNEYLNLFDKIKYNPKNSYVYLNTFIKLKNEESFTSYHKRELNDLINLIQKLALNLDSTSLFYDISIYKDKLSIFNERFFPNGVKFKDLPTIQQVSLELVQKTPTGQSIISLFPFGKDIIKIKIADSIITGKIIANESLKIRNDTFLYYNSISKSGSSPILREFLETKLRKILLLDKKKRTYLYLSSYLLKIPIEYKEEDNFFIIHSPDLLISNEPQKFISLFENKFSTSMYQSNDQSRALINKLERIELYKNEIQSKTKISYLSQKLYLKDKKTMYLDNLEFSKSNFPKIENGILLLANSDLYKTSLNKEDLFSIIQTIESSHKGQILYSFTPQYNETDPILFYKEFLNNYDYPVNIKSRFVNSIKLLKNMEKKEITYIGYRMSTNCFLVD